MSPERWERVKALLQSALERGAIQERTAFLDEACKGDLTLRNEVESLLAAHQEADSFIEKPAAELAAPFIANTHSKIVEGQTIGSYKILEKLGAGGMGTVYLAVDTRLGRKVALKLLPEHLTNDLERVRRFRQEARAASLLNYPNIVTIYEIGQSEKRDFIATEFVEGETLRGLMLREHLSLPDALTISVQVANAMAAAHDRGIIHRDIKPENIMLRPDGLVKVLDFGLAKLTEKLIENQPTDFKIPTSKLAYTEPGVVMGTARYMSPEQAQGLAVDERTDIWSFGVMLYEMITGSVPFDGPTMSHVIVAILEQEPAPLEQQSPELQRIVTKSLQKDRAKRYQTVKEMLADLNNLKQELEFIRRFKDTSVDTNETFLSQTASQKIQTLTEPIVPNPLAVPVTKRQTISRILHFLLIGIIGLFLFITLIIFPIAGAFGISFTFFLLTVIIGLTFVFHKLSRSQNTLDSLLKKQLEYTAYFWLIVFILDICVLFLYLTQNYPRPGQIFILLNLFIAFIGLAFLFSGLLTFTLSKLRHWRNIQPTDMLKAKPVAGTKDLVASFVLLFSLIIVFGLNLALHKLSDLLDFSFEKQKYANSDTARPETPERLRSDARNVLDKWKSTMMAHDLDAHIALYADTLDIYQDKLTVPVQQVRDERKKLFEMYYEIKIDFMNVVISLEPSGNTAEILFEKNWEFKSKGSEYGQVRRKIWLKRINGRWLITGEKDLQLFYKETSKPK